MKKIIDFLVKVSNVLSYIADYLRMAQFHEEYYVYVPAANKPRFIHKNYKSALTEAERLYKMPDIHEVEVLQVVNRFEDEIPF